jgi:hypothetical protein
MNPVWVEDDLIFIRVVTFYPASGYRHCASGAFGNTGSNGYAYSCALSGVNAFSLGIWSTVETPINIASRAFGLAVRCVQYLHLFNL